MSCAWVALALAACALAARGEDGMRARCAPEAGERCKLVAFDELTDTFLVNGHEHKISYEKVRNDPTALKEYSMSCAVSALEDVAWPRFKRLQRCRTVTLTSCSAASAAAALRTLQIAPTEALKILSAPSTPPLPRTAFTGLPDTLFELFISVEGGVLETEPGALDVASVKYLELENVHLTRLPPHTTDMYLNGSGVTELLDGMLNLNYLRIQEENLKSISGSAPKLTALKLVAPSLETLSLSDLGDLFVPEGLIGECPLVHTLEINRMRTSIIQAYALRNARSLRKFVSTHGEVTFLWTSFFNEAPNLTYIDLSNNKISFLLREQFTSLWHLKTLHLENNQFTDVKVVARLSWLQELHLAGNPLGDLCPSGESQLASLRSLRVLDLSHTGAVRVCPDWPRLRALRDLALRDNAVRVLPCAAQRADLRIDLTGNPLTPGCEKEQPVATSATPSQVMFSLGIGSHFFPLAAMIAQVFLFPRIH